MPTLDWLDREVAFRTAARVSSTTTTTGSTWVTIDDHEGHHLKVLMDEVFGRVHFIASAVWRSSE